MLDEANTIKNYLGNFSVILGEAKEAQVQIHGRACEVIGSKKNEI